MVSVAAAASAAAEACLRADSAGCPQVTLAEECLPEVSAAAAAAEPVRQAAAEPVLPAGAADGREAEADHDTAS